MSEGTSAHDYVLGRDYLAAARLNLQHVRPYSSKLPYLWTQVVGYHLHPIIAAQAPGSKIADIGTGTAVWAIDLATQIPTATVYGFDIDLSQAPPKRWLPENFRLDTMDAFEDPPEHLVGQFDVIHIRLFVCIVRDDPRPLLRNLMKLLKPGGYIQWGEQDPTNIQLESAYPELSIDSFKEAVDFPSTLGRKDSRMDARWVGQLGSIFEEEGMAVLVDEHKFRLPCQSAYFTDVCFMVWEEWRAKMDVENAAKFGKLLDTARKAREDSNGGLAVNMEIRIVVSQKPLV